MWLAFGVLLDFTHVVSRPITNDPEKYFLTKWKRSGMTIPRQNRAVHRALSTPLIIVGRALLIMLSLHLVDCSTAVSLFDLTRTAIDWHCHAWTQMCGKLLVGHLSICFLCVLFRSFLPVIKKLLKKQIRKVSSLPHACKEIKFFTSLYLHSEAVCGWLYTIVCVICRIKQWLCKISPTVTS